MKAPEIIRGPVTNLDTDPPSEVWYIKCPGCGLVASADEDQMHGRVSIDCPECEYHETVRIFAPTEGEGGEDELA